MINVISAIKTKNNVLRNLLSEFVTLKFIGVNKTTKQRSYIGTATKNWFYRKRKDPLTGLITEHVYFVSTTPTERVWANECTSLDLVRPDNTFLRFVLNGPKLEPSPPGFEWDIVVRPNAQDTVAI